MIVRESKGENHQTIDTFPLDRPAKIEANKAHNRIEHEQQTFSMPNRHFKSMKQEAKTRSRNRDHRPKKRREGA